LVSSFSPPFPLRRVWLPHDGLRAPVLLLLVPGGEGLRRNRLLVPGGEGLRRNRLLVPGGEGLRRNRLWGNGLW
jgi:hypothetical protein